MSVREITDPKKIEYCHDRQGNECLAIDITGLDLKKGGCLWVWVYKPKTALADRGVYLYPHHMDTSDCTPSNSRLTELAGELERERGDKGDKERIWIPLQVPDDDLSGVQYLLLRTGNLDVPGWGWEGVPIVLSTSEEGEHWNEGKEIH